MHIQVLNSCVSQNQHLYFHCSKLPIADCSNFDRKLVLFSAFSTSSLPQEAEGQAGVQPADADPAWLDCMVGLIRSSGCLGCVRVKEDDLILHITKEVESMIMGASYHTPRVEGRVKQVFSPAQGCRQGWSHSDQGRGRWTEVKDANCISLWLIFFIVIYII